MVPPLYHRLVDADRLLDGLDGAQRRAVTSEAQPLAILAGPGSGKTRVLTRRIAYRCANGSADPRHVLAVTFTRKAASELDDRLRRFGLRDLPAAGTFHALAYAQLRNRWAAAGQAPPVLLDRKVRFLARILGNTTRFSPLDLAAEIEWAKARLVAPDGYPVAAAQADRRTVVPADRVAEWYRRYESDKRHRRVVDFDDLLGLCAEAIEVDPSFAVAQRWRFRHLFVDEYQDLNPLQERLLRAWLGDRADLCVVGDPDQAIYGWNGADPSYLVKFADHHPGAEIIALDRSYRSTPQIIAAATAAITGGERGGSHRRRPNLVAVRSAGPVPKIVGYASDVDEANGVARAVHDHHAPGRPWSAQAILVRTNAQTSLFEAALRRAAIPYRVRGGRNLLDEPDVRDLLRRFDSNREPLSITLADLADTIQRRRGELDDDPPAASAVGRLIEAEEQVLRFGRDLLIIDPSARTASFNGWLRTTLRDENTQRGDAVSIVSLHASKGLEWPVVHLTGLEKGLVPSVHARTVETQREERRLLYVAMTRAADTLRCSWAAERTFGEQTVSRTPSPFLDSVQAELEDQDATAEALSAPPPVVLAAARQILAESASPRTIIGRGDSLRDDLRAWRAHQARRSMAAPTVILSDRALEALAHRRPTTADELARIADLGSGLRARWGDRLLAIVAEHPEQDSHPLVPDAGPVHPA